MRASAEVFSVHLNEAPVEAPGAIGTVERDHAPLQLANERIRADSDRQMNDQEFLRLAVFAVSSTAGPDG